MGALKLPNKKYLSYRNKRKVKDWRFYSIWRGMVSRCTNPKSPSYPRYGGRKPIPVKICDRWLDYFNFEDDMLESYIKHVEEYGEKDTTLDRIDYNGNYELNNVRWATIKEQANNRRDNFIVVDNLTLTQFSEKYNLPVAIVWYRIHHGWTIERIINTPIRKISPKMYAPTGESIKEVAERLEVSESTIKARLKRGWSWEKIFDTEIRSVNHYYLPCGKSLSSHCICNNYSISAIIHYIQQYNLSPDEAIARYLDKTCKYKSLIKYYLPCNNGTKTLKEHCNLNNYNYFTVMNYIYRNNLTAEQALAKYLENNQKRNQNQVKPKAKKKQKIIVLPTGETLTEFSKRTGISRKTLESRIHRGWSLEKIVNTPLQEKHNHK